MLNTSEQITCHTFNEPGNFHFELRCEDCDTQRLARLDIAGVEDRYHQGRVTQDGFEAYMYVWALLSPARSRGGWRETPDDPTVRRIARKLLVLRGIEIPAELVDAQVVELNAVSGPAADEAVTAA